MNTDTMKLQTLCIFKQRIKIYCLNKTSHYVNTSSNNLGRISIYFIVVDVYVLQVSNFFMVFRA